MQVLGRVGAGGQKTPASQPEPTLRLLHSMQNGWVNLSLGRKPTQSCASDSQCGCTIAQCGRTLAGEGLPVHESLGHGTMYSSL